MVDQQCVGRKLPCCEDTHLYLLSKDNLILLHRQSLIVTALYNTRLVSQMIHKASFRWSVQHLSQFILLLSVYILVRMRASIARLII